MLTAHALWQRSIPGTLLPMQGTMSESAANPTLSDPGGDGNIRPSVRERLGVAAFVVVAVVATATWIVLLVWGVVQLIRHL